MPTILIVDDDADLREMLSLLLEQAGDVVLAARDGAEGLRLAESARPDAILLDVMMPGLDGHEVLRRLKRTQATADIPVVMLTAVSTTQHVLPLLANGARDYIVKPFQPGALVERVHRLLRADRLEASSGPGGQTADERLLVVAHQRRWQTDLLARRLESRGRLLLTDNGLEALALLLSSRPSALFAGLDLDGIDGQELLRRVREVPALAGLYAVGLAAAPSTAAERARLLAAGFDDVLLVPPTTEAIDGVLARAGRPRVSFAHVRDNVVVFAVVSLDTAASLSRLRDAVVDYLNMDLSRVVVDLTYSSGADATARSLAPFLAYLFERGVAVRLVLPGAVARERLSAEVAELEVFPSVEAAMVGWVR